MNSKLNEAAAALGRRGGKKKSEAKTEAAQNNGRLGGAPSLRERAQSCYDHRPCNYADTDDAQTGDEKLKRSFARRLAVNDGYKSSPNLVDAIVRVIDDNE